MVIPSQVVAFVDGVRISIVYGGAKVAFVPHGPFEYLYSFESSSVEGCFWQGRYHYRTKCPFRCSLHILSRYGIRLLPY